MPFQQLCLLILKDFFYKTNFRSKELEQMLMGYDLFLK